MRLSGVYGVTITDATGCTLRKEIAVPEIMGRKTLFVSLVGSDESPGIRSKPLRNIQFAINSACDGDTIVLSRGVYQGTVDFKGKGLTLRSDYTGEAPSTRRLTCIVRP